MSQENEISPYPQPDFAIEYAQDPERAVRRVQWLLADDDAAEKHQAFLKALHEAIDASPGEYRPDINQALQVLEAGIVEAWNKGKLDEPELRDAIGRVMNSPALFVRLRTRRADEEDRLLAEFLGPQEETVVEVASAVASLAARYPADESLLGYTFRDSPEGCFEQPVAVAVAKRPELKQRLLILLSAERDFNPPYGDLVQLATETGRFEINRLRRAMVKDQPTIVGFLRWCQSEPQRVQSAEFASFLSPDLARRLVSPAFAGAWSSIEDFPRVADAPTYRECIVRLTGCESVTDWVQNGGPGPEAQSDAAILDRVIAGFSPLE